MLPAKGKLTFLGILTILASMIAGCEYEDELKNRPKTGLTSHSAASSVSRSSSASYESDDSTATVVSKAPVPGGAGQLLIDNVTHNSIVVNWSKALDDQTALRNLIYSVVISESNNIDSTLKALANGKVVFDWSKDVNSAYVGNLKAAATYYVNVLVRDEQQQTAAYISAPITLATHPIIHLSLTADTIHRRIISSTEPALRKVKINHNAERIECSSDNGTTFSACPSADSFEWSANQFNTAFVVRAFMEQAVQSPVHATFTPAIYHSSVDEVVTCSAHINASEPFDTFASRLNAGAVVCLANGVEIQNSNILASNTINVNAANVTVYVPVGATSKFSNLRTNSHLSILRANASAFKVVGATFESYASAPVVEMLGSQGLIDDVEIRSRALGSSFAALSVASQNGTRIYDSKIDTMGADGLHITSSAGNIVHDLEIETVNGGVGTHVADGGGVQFSNIKVSSAAEAIRIESSPISGKSVLVEISDSILSTTDSSSNSQVVNVVGAQVGGGNLKLQASQLVASGGGPGTAALAIDGQYVSVDLMGNFFKRLNSGSANTVAIMIKNTFGNGAVLSGDSSPNYFCQEIAGGWNFSSIIDESLGDSQYGFNVGSQYNGGEVFICD